jgi:multiple sugar transport system ATP-binding protein
MATLDLVDVRKSFGKTDVIHGIDLSIRHGEFIVFVGPSGCGKSTLLRMIAGLEPTTSGDVRIDGERVNDVPAAQRGLAMVFQSYALYPHMSVRQNMSFGLENLAMPRTEIETRVTSAARMLRLDQLLERKPGQLSGGQRQRVAIGRAVVREPKIFLFDEPLSNLDAELRVTMRSELAALHQRLGNTMVFVTHDQVEAMTLAARIAVLRAGRLEQFAAPLDLYNAPASLFVAGFIGSPRMNFLPASVAALGPAGARVTLPGGATLDVPANEGLSVGEGVTFGLRPEHTAIVAPEAGVLRLEVANVEQLGGEAYLYGALPSGETYTVRLAGQTRIARGETVGLSVGPDARVHLFRADERAVPRLPGA